MVRVREDKEEAAVVQHQLQAPRQFPPRRRQERAERPQRPVDRDAVVLGLPPEVAPEGEVRHRWM